MPGTAVGKRDYTGQLRRSPIPDSATFHWNSANAGRASALALQLPMPYATLDLILRTAIFTLAMAAAAAVLVRSKRSERGVPAGLSAIAIGGIGAFAVSSAPAALAQYGPVVLLFDAWCIATPAVIWILAQSLFRENFRPGPAHWLLAGIITIVTFTADWGRFGLGILGEAPQVAEKILFAGRGAALVFVLAAGYAAIAHWRVDLVESRRRARGVFVTIIVMVFATLAVSDFVFGPAGASTAWLVPAHLGLVAITLTLLLVIARGGMDELFVATAAIATEAIHCRFEGQRSREPPHRRRSFARDHGGTRQSSDRSDDGATVVATRRPRHRATRRRAPDAGISACGARSTSTSATATSTISCTITGCRKRRGAWNPRPTAPCQC